MQNYFAIILILIFIGCKSAPITDRDIENVKTDIDNVIESGTEEQKEEVLKDSKEIIIKLEKENKQCYKDLTDYDKTISGLIEKNKELEIDNDLLKKENKKLKKGGLWKTVKKVGYIGGTILTIGIGFKLGIFSIIKSFILWLLKKRKDEK